jgi:hypothetical protein
VNGFFVLEGDTVQGHNVDGLAALETLEEKHGKLPPTLMAQSPSGSVHRYFRHPGGNIKIKNSDSEIAPGVDVRGDGGMVIAPPSVRDGGAYRWLNDLPIANAPPWLLDLVIERPVVREPNESGDFTADETELAAAVEVIPNPDLGWHAWNRIGMALWRGTSGSEGGRAMWHKFSEKSEKYNARTTDEKWQEYFTSPPDQIGAGTILWEADQASPGWRSQFDLRIEAAFRDAGLHEIIEVGVVTAEPSDAEPQVAVSEDEATVLHGLDKVTTDDTSSQDPPNSQDPPKADRNDISSGDIADEIANVNRDYALVLAGNNAVVMKFEGGTKFRLLQVSALKYWYGNRYVLVGKEARQLSDVWLRSGRRRQYEGIEFAPGGGRPGYYNLWQGFSVEPRAGDCSKFLAHLRDNVAKHDEAIFNWVVGWFAQIVQEPTNKLGTSLALRGPQGAGKTKVGEVVGSLFSDHYALVADPRYITGNFNSHMKSLLLLHADEAFWAGDKRAEGRLKDLVTGSFFFLELKHIDPIPVANYLRLFVTGNQDWLVPAGFGERRFAVLDMGEEHVKDLPYFAAIDEEMNNGGREALLHYLLNFDLSRVNLRVIPKTTALLEQQIVSATPQQSWWLDTLRSGKLPSGATKEPNKCPKRKLFLCYVRHAERQGVRHKVSETAIGIFLKKYVGSKLVGDERMQYHVYNRNGDKETRRDWAYRFPPLAECRTSFAKELQQDIAWGKEWQSEEWQSEDEPVKAEDEEF